MFDKDTKMYHLPLGEKKLEEEKGNTNLVSVAVDNVENVSEQQWENESFQLKYIKPLEARGNKDREEKLICRGKECCKEFIKGLFAAIPLQEL